MGMIPLFDIAGVKSYKGTLPGIEEENIVLEAQKGSAMRAKSKPTTKLILQNTKLKPANQMTTLNKFTMNSAGLRERTLARYNGLSISAS